MNLNFRLCLLCLLCLVAPGWGGCSAVGGDEPREQCLSSCNNTLTFLLATPLSGRELAISIGLPDGSIEHIDCQPGDASVACLPVGSRVEPSFAANGALEFVRLAYPPTGNYAVQITVDGTPAAAGAFSYQPPGDAPYTGPCPGVRCAGPQTFTIGN